MIPKSFNMTESNITVKTANTLVSLPPLSDAWNRLYFSANSLSPTMTFSWIYSFLENRPENYGDWSILLAYGGDELAGVLPIIRLPSKSGLETPFDWHTISVDFLLKPGRENDVIEAMVKRLSEIYPGWSRLALRRIPESSPVIAALKTLPAGLRSLLEYNGKGSYVKMQGNFDSFFDGLSKNFKKNLKKSVKNVESLGTINLNVIKGHSITERDIDRFLALESSGWKGQSGSAIGKSTRLTAFYKNLCRRLADDNILEWHFLETDSDLLAAQMAFRIKDRLTVNKIAYNETFAQHSPGNYLFLKTVENAFSAGDIAEIDCLTDMPWHRNWQLPQRDYYDIYIFPRTLSTLLLGVLPLKIKARLKKVRLIRSVRDSFGFLRLRH